MTEIKYKVPTSGFYSINGGESVKLEHDKEYVIISQEEFDKLNRKIKYLQQLCVKQDFQIVSLIKRNRKAEKEFFEYKTDFEEREERFYYKSIKLAKELRLLKKQIKEMSQK